MSSLTLADYREQAFGNLPDCLRLTASTRPGAPALTLGGRTLHYAELDALADRIAAAAQRDGLPRGARLAVCATTSIEYVAVYVGVLRAGMCVVPLAPSSTPDGIAAMAHDADAAIFFTDTEVAAALDAAGAVPAGRRVTLDGSTSGTAFEAWLAPQGNTPAPVALTEADAFNIIYSSGTTGTPKGIVHSHAMRWSQLRRTDRSTFDGDGVLLVATPLYSNTTLTSVLPALAAGAHLVLMPKFDAGQYLALAEQHRATHTMLVPVQYQRLMQHPDMGRRDLSAFQMKYCVSAPFSAALKADVLARWPGGLTEYYGMTEGGGSTMLLAHQFPDKLHTVGQPIENHEIRLIGEDGREVAPGEPGEIVGRSAYMMTGYHKLPQKSAEAEWHDDTGRRFIRTGDVGRFDEDGFLILMDRKKDMVISGGFNIYPSDLEAVLARHPAVQEVAVVGVPSEAWGETPAAFVVLRQNQEADATGICTWANGQLGKTQRIGHLRIRDALPRSAIGKILKRELRDSFDANAQGH